MPVPSSAPSPTRPFAESMPPARLYLSLNGRIGRASFWRHGVLGLGSGGVVLLALLDIAGLEPEAADRWVNGLLLWPAVAISTKRWHDRNRSGWWVLISLVPVVGWLWALVENGLLAGKAHANAYGPPPEA